MENKITVEKGVPVPDALPNRSRYPWHDLAVGDSFLVPYEDSESAYKASRTLYQCASRQKALGRGTFMVKRVDGGIRVWRTA